MRRLAELLQPVPSETPFGGQAVNHEPLGWVWLKPGARRRRERNEAGDVHAVETLTAEARPDPRLSEGRVLRFDGADWTVVLVDPARPGRATLSLERNR